MILLLGALGELAEGSTRGEMISDVGAPRELVEGSRKKGGDTDSADVHLRPS